MFKKYYDTAIADAGGGATEVAEPTIAELMGKSGTRSTDDSPAEKPENTEKKEEPKTEPVDTPAAPAKDQKETAKATPETQPEVKVEKVETPIEKTIPPTQSWQEVLKSQQPDTVLRELGFDDKVIGLVHELKDVDPKMLTFLSKWKNQEDLKGYLKELTTDYSKMSSEEVMRHQLRGDYPKASESQLNSLYKQKVINAYSLDPQKFTEDEMDEGRLLLDAEADKYRDALMERQQTFLLPKPPEAKAPEPDLQLQEQERQVEAYKVAVNTDPYFREVNESKKITIGKGDEKYNLPVNPEVLKSVLFDQDKWVETQNEVVRNADGSVKSITPKVDRQLLVAAFALDPDKFLNDYFQFAKSLGAKAVIEPIHNAKPPEGQSSNKSEAQPKSAAEAMAKGGVLVSGGM